MEFSDNLYVFYSYLIDLAGLIWEMRKLGAMSTKRQMTRVAALMSTTRGRLSSTGTVLT